MDSLDRIRFNTTLEINRDYIITCRVCGKTSNIISAHSTGWCYRSRLSGSDKLHKFLCRECKENL